MNPINGKSRRVVDPKEIEALRNKYKGNTTRKLPVIESPNDPLLLKKVEREVPIYNVEKMKDMKRKIMMELTRKPLSTTSGSNAPKVSNGIDSTIDPSSRDQIDRIVNSQAAGTEIEVSFGTYGIKSDDSNPPFHPGLLSVKQFELLLNYMIESFNDNEHTTSSDIVEIMQDGQDRIRKVSIITDDGEISSVGYERKIRTSTIENYTWGYRVSVSKEEPVESSEIDENLFAADITRYRKRHSFKANSQDSKYFGFRFDLSYIKEVKKDESVFIKYEVEIEKLQTKLRPKAPLIVNLENCISLVLLKIQDIDSVDKLLSLEEIKSVFKLHNELFSFDIGMIQKAIDEKARKDGKPIRPWKGLDNPYKLFKDYWNKPTNITIDDMINVHANEYSVTVKLDGIRRFIFITDRSVYSMSPPSEIYRIGDGIPDLNGSLLDTEMYTHKDGSVTYYVFDVLFSKGNDARESNFDGRLKELTRIVEKINLTNPFYKVEPKHFFMNGSFYDKTSAALDWIDSNPDVESDGLIFQPSKKYKNNFTRKWKYQHTIDFLLKRESSVKDSSGEVTIGSNNTYIPYVSGKNGDEPFKGTKKFPYSKYIESTDRYNYSELDQAIVECRWDDDLENFVIYRIRTDRDRPNAIDTARDIWSDINRPITRDVITGKTLKTMRRYHNIIKDILLKTEFPEGSIIMDWGSGRGGDIKKWLDNGFEKVFVVEPNPRNFEEFERRKDEILRTSRDDYDGDRKGKTGRFAKANARKPNKNIDIEVCSSEADGRLLGGEDTDELVNIIKYAEAQYNSDQRKKYAKQPELIKTFKLDGIVAFFSLTFFGKNKKRWEDMLESLDRLIPEGGKLVGIVMDGHRTKSLLESVRKAVKLPGIDSTGIEWKKVDLSGPNVLEEDDPAVYTNESFSIAQASEFTNSLIGDEIEIEIFEGSSMVKNDEGTGGQTEWLFHFSKFEEDLKSRGFRLERTAFLDKDPVNKTEFDVLPLDSKIFSSLNRYFVFRKMKSVKGQKLTNRRRPIETLASGIVAEEGNEYPYVNIEDFNLIKMGVVRDSSSILHCVMRAVDKAYVKSSKEVKKNKIKSLRNQLAEYINKDATIFEHINAGGIASKYRSLAAQTGKVSTEEEIDNLAIKLYQDKLRDYSKHITEEDILELVETGLKINLLVMGADGRVRIALYDSRKKSEILKRKKLYPVTIVITTTDGVHYDLVGLVKKGEGDRDVKYSFSRDDPLINTLVDNIVS